MPYKAYQPKPGATGATNNGNQATVQAQPPTAAAPPQPTMAKPEDSTEGGDMLMDPSGDNDAWTGTPADSAAAQAWAAAHPGKKFFPKKFAGIAKGYKPVPNAIKKKRFNYRLRKIITPKAPVMVLNEMVGPVNYTFLAAAPHNMGNMAGNVFMAQCQVDGKTYSGCGPSKQYAKNVCAEQAIQAVVSKKCQETKEKMAKQQEQLEGDHPKPNLMEDETPWAQLASLALFKMFNEWQNQGFQIPSELLRAPDHVPTEVSEVGSIGSSPQAVTSPAAAPQPPLPKKLPEDPTSRHPVQLLNEILRGATFNLVGEAGVPPNTIFTMGIEVEGRLFTGEGRNKKDAKKNCAMVALKELYNIVYPKPEGVQMDESA